MNRTSRVRWLKKLREGNIILSPYTLWSIQLENKRDGFSKLARFKGLVDIKLTGSGQYVKQNIPICSSDLDKFYELADENLINLNDAHLF